MTDPEEENSRGIEPGSSDNEIQFEIFHMTREKINSALCRQLDLAIGSSCFWLVSVSYSYVTFLEIVASHEQAKIAGLARPGAT